MRLTTHKKNNTQLINSPDSIDFSVMKKCFLYLLCLTGSVVAQASHLAGGTLRYEYTGTGNIYRINLTQYHECSPGGAILDDTAYINIMSSGCGNIIGKKLPLASVDTTLYACPSLGNSCTTPTSGYPGIAVYHYTDTVVLPPCSSWKIEWTGGSRNASITNLVLPGSQNVYLEAFLDNSSAINNNAYTPSAPPYVLATNMLNTAPYPAADADGDSIHYDFITPMGAPGTPLSYSGGYSFSLPFGSGSTAQIDQIAQTIKLRSNFMGRFAIALRISEYRNGQLIGYSSSDWCVISTAIATAATVPAPAPGTNFSVNTCPGQPNSVSFIYYDSTATDSVFLAAVTPTMPGWTFSATATAAPGVGNLTVTWTTPASANPATLPSFFINVKAHDNACPMMGSATYPLLVRLAQCTADSVWPGDANADYTVNMYDPLAIAVAYGQGGSVRPGASASWVAQYCPNWANFFAYGPNMKHADCNGDGNVNGADLAAVTTNYGQVHFRQSTGSQQRATNVPDLYFDLSAVSLFPGIMVSVPIKLGSGAVMANNIYGLAAGITISGVTLNTAPVITYNNSWLGTPSNTLSFTKTVSNNQTDWAYARTDHQNISGQGTIAYLNFTVPANATVGQQLIFNFQNSKLIDNAGNDILAYNALSDTAVIPPLSVNAIHGNIQAATVVPNPVKNESILQLSVAHPQELTIKIVNTLGQIMWQQNAAVAGTQNIMLPTGTLAAGLYLIVIKEDVSASPSVIRFVKE